MKGSVPRDDNFVPMTANESIIVKKAVTFAAASTGSIGQHALFTVTGDVVANVFGIVNTTLADAGAPTISVGTANNVAVLIGVTTAKNLADGDVWVDTTDTRVEVGAVPAMNVINDGADITYNILVATVTSGQIDFYCTYRPLEGGASIVAA